jgi:nucleotide-binding universal stress UspA family protein
MPKQNNETIPIMKLLALVDFSEVTPSVLREARRWAKRMSARLWLLHVAAPDPDFVGYELDPRTMRDALARKFHDEHRRLESAAQELRETGLDATALLVQGPTVETILKEADKLGVEAILLGSHGHGAIHDLLVGSTTKGIIRLATCPILLVPPHDSEAVRQPDATPAPAR